MKIQTQFNFNSMKGWPRTADSGKLEMPTELDETQLDELDIEKCLPAFRSSC